jgi:hypothetical protein
LGFCQALKNLKSAFSGRFEPFWVKNPHDFLTLQFGNAAQRCVTFYTPIEKIFSKKLSFYMNELDLHIQRI